MSTGSKSRLILLVVLLGILLSCFCHRQRLSEAFTQEDPMIVEIHGLLSVVDPEAANSITIKKGEKSYTVNKKHMHLCLLNEEGNYFNKNMLMYVALHELAHVKCKSIGHTPEFHQIFDELLEKASRIGVYNPEIPPVSDYQDRCRI